MWFSVVYSFVDNDTRHHSGQNVVDSRGAAEWVCNNNINNHINNDIKETTPTRIWKCTRCIMQMCCLYASHSFRNFCKLAYYAETIRKNAWEQWWHPLVTDKSTYHEKPHFDLFFTTISTTKKMFFFFQSASWKRHCVTHWREQRGRDSYLPRQISQSDCEISYNCGKNIYGL